MTSTSTAPHFASILDESPTDRDDLRQSNRHCSWGLIHIDDHRDPGYPGYSDGLGWKLVYPCGHRRYASGKPRCHHHLYRDRDWGWGISDGHSDSHGYGESATDRNYLSHADGHFARWLIHSDGKRQQRDSGDDFRKRWHKLHVDGQRRNAVGESDQDNDLHCDGHGSRGHRLCDGDGHREFESGPNGHHRGESHGDRGGQFFNPHGCGNKCDSGHCEGF